MEPLNIKTTFSRVWSLCISFSHINKHIDFVYIEGKMQTKQENRKRGLPDGCLSFLLSTELDFFHYTPAIPAHNPILDVRAHSEPLMDTEHAKFSLDVGVHSQRKYLLRILSNQILKRRGLYVCLYNLFFSRFLSLCVFTPSIFFNIFHSNSSNFCLCFANRS